MKYELERVSEDFTDAEGEVTIAHGLTTVERIPRKRQTGNRRRRTASDFALSRGCRPSQMPRSFPAWKPLPPAEPAESKK